MLRASYGICSVTPPASLLLPTATPNSASSPVLPLVCTAAASVPMDATQATALMNVKVALGVSSLKGLGLTGSIHSEISKLTTLTVLDLQSNRLEGKMDAFTANIKAPLVLKELSVAFNYLTGSLPTALPTTLASLDVQSNFLAGSVPANTIPYCASTGNCLVDASKCASLGLPQRSAAECAVCDSTNGQGALCAAATSCRVAAAGAGVTTPPTALSATLTFFCEAVPMDLVTTQTMLAIKAALGVTLTDWAGSLGTCTLEGQTPGPGVWTGVYYSSKGAVVGIDLSSNLFQRRLDVFLSLVSALKALKNIHLQYNWFSSSIPSSLVALPALSTLKLNRNYLTGTVPAFKTSLKALNVASNLLSGAFPIATLTACDARSNCLSSASKCANAAGTAQRLSSECSVCGSTDASGVLCGGGLCAPDASAPAASSTPNTDGQPLLPLSCLGVPMDAAMGLALLSVKASLGVTFTDWNVDAPCALAGQAVVPGSWSSVVCDATGKVLSLYVHNNYLSGAVPPSLTTFSALSELKIQANYLTGSMPAALPASLKYLDASGNYLVGTFPTTTTTYCSCASNCFKDSTKCTSASTQRAPAACAICGSTNGTGVLCDGGTCAPSSTALIAAKTVNTGTAEMYCAGDPMDAAMAAALLSVKASLGVSFTSWAVSSPCAVEGVAAPPGAWSNVLCNSALKPVSLKLSGQKLAGKMHSDISKLSTLTSVDFSSNLLQGRLDAFTTSFKALTSLKQASASLSPISIPLCFPPYSLLSLPLPTCPLLPNPLPSPPVLNFLNSFHLNSIASPIAATSTSAGSVGPSPLPLSASPPSHRCELPFASRACVHAATFGASYNYLYGPVPKFGTALKTIDVQKNWLSGTFPGTGFLSCSASSNCLASTGACNTTGTTQRPLASCAVCDSPTGADPICAGGTCAPNTAAPLASSTTPTTSSPILPRFCVGVPLNAAQAAILLSVKTALGITFTEWSASTLALSPKANTVVSEFRNGLKAMERRRLAESEAGRKRVLLVAPPSGQAGLCTIQGQTPVAGSWPGVFCSSAGMVVGLDLRSFLLRGTVHADISKLTTLTALYLSSNLFYQRLDSFVAPILPTAPLKEFYNYLTGSLPKPGATLKILDTQANFLSGTFPTATLAACNARLNCFSDASACPNLDGTAQRPATGCNMCGSPTKKQPTLCGGGTCMPILSPSLAKVPNSAAAPILPMACAAVPLDAASGEPLPSFPPASVVTPPPPSSSCAASQFHASRGHVIPSSLTTLKTCMHPLSILSPPPPLPSTCTPTGSGGTVEGGGGSWGSAWSLHTWIHPTLTFTASIPTSAPSFHPTSRPSSPSFPCSSPTCSCSDLSYNLFSGQLPKFVSNMLPLTTMATLNLNSNYLYDSIPSALVNMPRLTELRLGANYLTGTLPAMATQLQVLAIASNLLAGAFPTQPFQLCDIRSNCLSSPGSCTNDAGVAQRTSGCAFCGSATGAPPFCAGTACTPDVAARLAAGTVNDLAATLPAMFCQAVAVDDNSALALLALKAGLGVSASSWAVDSPCTLAGNAPAVDSWTGVVCDLSGQVLSLCVGGDVCEGDKCGMCFVHLCVICASAMCMRVWSLTYNWFSGPLPSFLLTMSSLSALNLRSNYLAGPITGTPSASLKSLDVGSNLLTGTFPASSTTACDARDNCLADSSKCLTSGSSSQRLASDCTLYGAGSSGAVICNGGVCAPDTTGPMASLTPNDYWATLLPMQCSGVRIDATAVSVLGSLKAALGVPLTDWGGNSLCTVVIVVSGVSSSSPGPRDLGGVLCSPAGAVVEINLNTRQLAGSIHADISKLTALTALVFHSNFLAGRLDAFTAPFTSLTKLENLQLHCNYLFGPIPSALIGLKSLSKLQNYLPCKFAALSIYQTHSKPPLPTTHASSHRSLGSNYLTGSVPVPSTTMKHLDLENNYLVGTFPTGSWQSCSARTNCFSGAAACTVDGGKGTVQRASCSICGSADGTGALCGGGGASTCQPTAASLASLSTLNGPSAPALPLECSLLPAVPVNSASMAALLSIKTALGVTHTGWVANAVCTLAGTGGTVASGSLTGVECDSAGNPVKITLNNQQLFGVLPADVTKLTALTHLNLQSNLFRARLEDFALRLPALTNLAVLLLDYNWFKGSLPPPLLAMTKLTRLSMAYNYLTYRVPPVSASLKAIVLSNNFLSGTFPANSATSCVSSANCFTSATSCNTPTEGGNTAQRAPGCDICGSASGQGMLCGGTGVCTPNAAALFTAKTANTAAAAVLPMACVDLVCAAAAPVACPTDWRCQGLKCTAPAVSNCIGYLCTP
ncbi:unnamed protein product [Closterium sp. Naga37s-1]|nr:unnamed protein product [Closterium sp. Naga37s-1]